jgi:hypothetical protein
MSKTNSRIAGLSVVLSVVLIVGTLVNMSMVLGQELEPFPTNRITESQWQTYFYEVQSSHGDSAQQVRSQHLVIFKDRKTVTTWTFTQIGHPAHPSWIARHLVSNGDASSIRQVGYFAGEDGPFAAFFQEQLQLNKKIDQQF